MSENHREPEVPEEKVPVVECLDGLARITSKELAITHVVKSGTLQNACSARPVKSIPPNTEKWLRKRYYENDNNNMSNEDKRETNYSMNNK